MTRFLALQLARSHTYDMRPARDDFGFVERVSMREATARTVAWWRAQLGGTGPYGIEGGIAVGVTPGAGGALPVASHERA